MDTLEIQLLGRLTEFLIREGLGSDAGTEMEEVGAGVEVKVEEV